jgi:ribonuclease HI
MQTTGGLDMIEAYSDGAGQNVRGCGAASFLIVKNQSIIHQETVPLIGKTNNEAEYIGVLSAIKWLQKEGYESFTCYLDSELVFKQLTNKYSVNKLELLTLHSEIVQIVSENNLRVRFSWVPRENKFIQVADRMNRVVVRQMM